MMAPSNGPSSHGMTSSVNAVLTHHVMESNTLYHTQSYGVPCASASHLCCVRRGELTPSWSLQLPMYSLGS